jgi:hypothetical protein
VQGRPPQVTATNAADLLLLSEEFGFTGLYGKVSQFQQRQSQAGDENVVARMDAADLRLVEQQRALARMARDQLVCSQSDPEVAQAPHRDELERVREDISKQLNATRSLRADVE